ncbi:MAG: neutral zinc metallopeptidase [Smithella sp.]|jgi:predicted metalloprotease
MRNFVAVVLAETEDVWNETFQQAGRTYEEPKLVLFSGSVESACDMADEAFVHRSHPVGCCLDDCSLRQSGKECGVVTC